MKILNLILCFSFILQVCSNGAGNIEKIGLVNTDTTKNMDYNGEYIKDSTEFMQFYSNFKHEKGLPSEFKMFDKSLNPKEFIPEKYIRKYICNSANFCMRTVLSGKRHALYCYKLEISKEFYAVIFILGEVSIKDAKLILATYSKKNFKQISQIVLAGENQTTYQLTSTMDDSLNIKTKTLYFYKSQSLYGKDGVLPNKKYPNYFYVVEYNSEYKINNDGTISFLNEKEEQYTTFGHVDGSCDYRVDLPKK